MLTKSEALAKAIANVGSRAKMASVLGVSVQAVGLWVRTGLPPVRARGVSAATKGKGFIKITELL